MTARGSKAEEVLAYVSTYICEHGYSPTIVEIGEGVGLDSKQSVHRHLLTLRRAGAVTWLDGQARTLRVVNQSTGQAERVFDPRYDEGPRRVLRHTPSAVAEHLSDRSST